MVPFGFLLLHPFCLFWSVFPFQTQGRESIAAKLVANLITEAGADRVLACDLHSGQSIGYFDIPVDHVYGQVSKKLHIKLAFATYDITCALSLLLACKFA